jgi:hypothetical protein
MRSDEKDLIAVEGTALSRIRPLAPPDDSRWNRLISRSPSPALDKKIENASVTIFVLPKISTKNFHARKSWKFQICTIENLYHEFFIERIFKQETQIFEFSYSNTKIR